jgi:hypothetical protein
MADFWALTFPAIIGAVAWLYQKTWERHERRLKQYEAILDELPAFTTASLDPERIDKVISVYRHLWLLGPDYVVRAFENFLNAVEEQSSSDSTRELALGNFVVAMRRDAGFLSAIIPRFRTSLRADEFRLKSASRRSM